MNRERSLYTFTLNWVHVSIIVVVTVVFIALLTASITMYVKCIESEQQYREYLDAHKTAKEQPESSKDKADTEVKTEPLDTQSTDYLLQRIKTVENTQENVLADLRQESNNIINKVNGWLGFWIAILAIFGGIMPIVIQYVLTQKTRREFDKMIDDLDKKAHSHHLFNLITSLHINKECSIIRDSSCQKDFISKIVNEAYQSTTHLIDKIDNGDGSLDRKAELAIISMLVQYCRLIELLKSLSSRRMIRELDNIETKVKTLIKDILDHENKTREKVWARLIDLLPRLSELHVYNQ